MLKAGYSIADISAIKALPTALIPDGYAKLCRSVNAWFSYDIDSSETANDISILLPASGVGRWFKIKAEVVDSSIGDSQISSISQSKITGLVDSLASKLSENQNITIDGDVTGSGTTAITLTLSDSGVIAGSYSTSSITVDSKGRVTNATNGTEAIQDVLSEMLIGGTNVSLDYDDIGNTLTINSTASTSGTSVSIKNEGNILTAAATSIDFVGDVVNTTNSGGDITVTISTTTGLFEYFNLI